MATLKMRNVQGKVLYEGAVTEEAFKYVARYDEPNLDLETVACEILHTWEGEVTELEQKLIHTLQEYEYTSWGNGENSVVWTMK